MSALGPKQTFALQIAMSALPPKADMCGALAHVRFGPIADIASLIRSTCQRERPTCQGSEWQAFLLFSGLSTTQSWLAVLQANRRGCVRSKIFSRNTHTGDPFRAERRRN